MKTALSMGPQTGPQSIFGIHVDFLRAIKGGFFLMKKPLECVHSVYSNSENAIACPAFSAFIYLAIAVFRL
jgi:hypothetical protein